MLAYSYVAGEGVEESVVVEEMREVELRSRRAQFVYYRIYNRIWLQPRGHVPSTLPVKELRRPIQTEKSKGICMEGYPEKCHFLLFLRIHN